MTIAIATMTGCAGDTDDAQAPIDSQPVIAVDASVAPDAFPEILDVVAEFDEDAGTWSFAVTVSSTYDTAERYADGWRVVGPDGTVYGVHTLTHDHAAEQPFTRRQNGVEIPADVTEVTIEGRDLVNGFGGTTMTIPLRGDR